MRNTLVFVVLKKTENKNFNTRMNIRGQYISSSLDITYTYSYVTLSMFFEEISTL